MNYDIFMWGSVLYGLVETHQPICKIGDLPLQEKYRNRSRYLTLKRIYNAHFEQYQIQAYGSINALNCT